MNQPFECKINAAPTYRLGDPILITFEIVNTSNESYQVLKWGTPLEGQFTLDCFTVERNGERIPYDGKRVSRGEPTANAYIIIGAGERIEASIDLSKAYAINREGDYTVTLKAFIFDAFVVPGKVKLAPRKRHEHELQKLPPSTVQFRVEEGMKPRLTEGQAARKVSKLADTGAKEPSFKGGTAKEQSETLNAHNNAQYFAALAVSQLTTTTANTNALYQTWFGVFDQSRYDKVTKIFGDISNTLLTEQVTYDLSGTGCETNWNAYSYDGSRTVWTCDGFWSLPPIDIDCQFSTILHEWSHAVGHTDDYAYGDTACQDLAINNPDNAVKNGDSYENFAERLAQSDFGKSFTFITDRNTFGRDEINAMLAKASPAVIPKAFYVIADGFWPEKLGITHASFGSSPDVKPTITAKYSISGMTISDQIMEVTVTSLEADDETPPVAPQRFTWVCQITFADDSVFPTIVSQVQRVTLTATLGTLSCSAQLLLICEQNPYELDGSVWWLSTDVRVFQIRPKEPRFGTKMEGATAADASAFIKQVIANLNADKSGNQIFESIPVDAETSSLELSEKVDGIPVFNFAIARVRYRGTSDISNVRVFFRLFPAATTSTDFNLDTTYYRAKQGTSVIPLLGLSNSGDLLTIPCFAEPRVDSAVTSISIQLDPANVQPITHDADGNEVSAYFGCWLDINQTSPQFPLKPSPRDGPWSAGRKSIQELIRNVHQCLVAEIAFDPEPIPAGASPAGSDKLAQRNLVIFPSANPGIDASRRIPTTFDLHLVTSNQVKDALPDELMIDWGNTPSGSLATIYLPDVSVTDILVLADKMYTTHRLEQADSHTLQCRTGSITYIPIPPGIDVNYAGLLSIDLPATVQKGQVFNIVVRQVTNAFGKRPPEPPKIMESLDVAATLPDLKWRRVVGAFQLTIPVSTKEVMLEPEERLLSVFRWIQKAIPVDNRWYTVFNRYVEQIANRVDALGGDSSQVEASPSGDWQKVRLCRTLAIICAVSLTIFIVALGIMTNWVAVAVIAVFLAVIAFTWVIQCQPNICSKLRVIVAGAGIGALILAILVLLGASSPQLVPVLCGAVALTAIASLIGRSRKCF